MEGAVIFRVQQSVPLGDHVIIVQAGGREQAKHRAAPYLLGDPDRYTVTPLTVPGHRVTYVGIGGD